MAKRRLFTACETGGVMMRPMVFAAEIKNLGA